MRAILQKRAFRKAMLFLLGFALLLPLYLHAVERRDLPSLCLSFGCFALFVSVLLRALLFPRPFAAADEDSPAADRYAFRRVCIGSLVWTLLLWSLIAFCIARFRYPHLPFWDALYADLSVNLDTRHYLDIAQHGYTPGVVENSKYIIVFFPLFAWLVRLVSLGGVFSYFIVACILNIVFAALLGPVLYKLVRLDFSPRASARAVRWLYILPASLFLVTPMTESLFLLLCLLYVYCLRTRRWQWLLPLGLAASLCRLQGVLLAVGAGVEYLSRFVDLLYAVKIEKASIRKPGQFLFLAGEALYGVAGLIGGVGVYLGINLYNYGDAFHFLSIQKSHWGQQLGYFFNTPAYMADYASRALASPDRLGIVAATSIPNLLAIFGVLLLLLAGGRRIRLSYVLYALTYYAVTVGATWLLSAPRYMSVLFPLAITAAALTDDVWYDRLLSSVSILLFVTYITMFLIKMPIY